MSGPAGDVTLRLRQYLLTQCTSVDILHAAGKVYERVDAHKSERLRNIDELSHE